MNHLLHVADVIFVQRDKRLNTYEMNNAEGKKVIMCETIKDRTIYALANGSTPIIVRCMSRNQ